MDTGETPSSCWADLQPGILLKVFADLPLIDGFRCERVCTVWRQALFSDGAFAGQNETKVLVLLHVVGSSQVHGDSSASVAELNISDHQDSLASWLSKRGSAFDAICFGTASRPLEVSVETWRSLFSACADTQGPQLKLSVSSKSASPVSGHTTDRHPESCSAARSSSDCFNTLHAGFDPQLMPVRLVPRQLCTALYIGSGPGLTPQQLMAISHLTSLQSLEISLPAHDYMGFIPSCWTQLSHLHSLTLNKCKAVPSVLATLASLRSLDLRFETYSRRLCLETLLQLTSLRISLDALHDESVSDVLLPKGRNVQLRHLMLRVGTHIGNVQYATKLTRLDMTIRVAMHIRWQWHVPLKNLKIINVFKLEAGRFQQSSSSCWPSIWQHSTSLERLTLHGWEITETPDWATKLQQLKRLDMPQACLTDLKVADLMQLPQLEQLNLGNFCFDQLNVLAPAIMECAYLPVLKLFTFGFQHGTKYTLEAPIAWEALQSRALSVLLQLQAGFVSHRFAPFHERQWTLTREHGLEFTKVNVVQFSCDDYGSRASIVQDCENVVAA